MKSSQAVRLAVIAVLGVAAAGGVWMMRGQGGTTRTEDLRAPATQLIATADIYRTEGAYVDSLLEHAHAEAVKAFAGGATPEAYYTAVLQSMVNKAKADGKDDVARSLRTFAVGKGYVGVKF